MKTFALFFIVTILLLAPLAALAAPSGEEPLTLLHRQQQGNQPSQISPVPSQGDELRDIYGPVAIKEPVPYLLLLGVAGLLLVLAFLFFRYRKKRSHTGPAAIPPWEKALRELAEARTLLSPENGLSYMDRVSTILRHYIESRFSIQSTRQTTREFLQGLQSVPPASPLNTYKNELQDCLEQADLAKFARLRPAQHDLELMEEAATTFVKKTEPKAAQEEEKL